MFGTRYDAIPPGLDKMEPGPMLAVILLAVEVRKLSGHDQIVVSGLINAWHLTSKPGSMTT